MTLHPANALLPCGFEIDWFFIVNSGFMFPCNAFSGLKDIASGKFKILR